MMEIGVIGTGFVGSAVCSAFQRVYSICAYDRAKGFLECNGIDPPIPNSLMQEDEAYRILAQRCEVIFVCVPTPMNKDGSCNIRAVQSVIRRLEEAVREQGTDVVAVIKSTIPPGTTEALADKIAVDSNLFLCFNPEFLRESSAVEDFARPTRIILGGSLPVCNRVKRVYQAVFPDVHCFKMEATEAEMVKYVTNCFLAAKVSIANEFSQLCWELGIDYDTVIEYATKDSRLGNSHWNVPGPDGRLGFGGSCFPKDLNALLSLARDFGVDCSTLEGAWQTNLKVRPSRDWEQLVGRAIMSDGN